MTWFLVSAETAGADRQERPGHQPAGEIAGEDHAVVRVRREN